MLDQFKTSLFSVIIPCYNQAHLLPDALNSLINQTQRNWEAIIVNDGSSDNTQEIADSFVAIEKRICLVNQDNMGLSEARNSGLKVARGRFLLFLDADDWLETNCFSVYHSWINKFPRAKLFRCSYGYWDRVDGRFFHTHIQGVSVTIYPEVLSHNIGPCHSILISREMTNNLGGFDPSLNSCEDWDFWIRVGKIGASIISIPEVLVAYRYVAGSMSRNPKVMYESLTEVSNRAGEIDLRLSDEAKFNKLFLLDYPEIQKNHLLTVLGVMLHQGSVSDAICWYRKEEKLWMWKIESTDWNKLTNYLSWGYFYEKNEIEKLSRETRPVLITFFRGLGYSDSKVDKLTRMVLSPQLKKYNHIRYGKTIGALFNKLGLY